MGDAPERIWALYAPEIEEDNPQCTIVAGEAVMYGAQQYVRADRIEQLEAVLREVDTWVDDLLPYAQEGHEPAAVFKRVKEVLNK